MVVHAITFVGMAKLRNRRPMLHSSSGAEDVTARKTHSSYIAVYGTVSIGVPPQSGILTQQYSNKKCVVKEGGAGTYNNSILARAAFARFFHKKLSDLTT